MENKKTFGEYICRRRKEKGLTQKEFAGKLYVTESAVSKWERGMSYPDITLIRDICAVLEISEHELLTASEDTERRTSEKLAAKYLRLTRRYRVVQYILYGGGLLAFVIGGMATGQPIAWFLVAAASLLLAASLTLAPAMAAARPALENHKWAVSLGCATLSLELLLLACCLYGGADWFPPAGISVLFGITLLLLPPVLPTLPLPAGLRGRKLSLYLAVETALFVLLLLTFALYTGGDWFAPAAVSTVFGLSLFCTPVFLRQLPLPQGWERRKLSLYLAVETVLFVLLLLTFALYTGGDWFLVAAASTVFGLSLFCTPVFLRQLPLSQGWERRKLSLYLSIETALLLLFVLSFTLYTGKLWSFPLTCISILFGLGLLCTPVLLYQLPLPQRWRQHKALLYCAIETVLLLLLLAAADCTFRGGWLLSEGLPITAVMLLLPWGLMAAARYLPVNGWFRGAACCGWSGLWLWLAPWAVDRIMMLNGWFSSNPYTLRVQFDFSDWALYEFPNKLIIILLSLGGLTLALTAAGFAWERRRKKG